VVGKNVVIGTGPSREIVGVVKDTKYDDVSAPARPMIYVPYRQKPWELGTIVVRTSTRPELLEDEIRKAVRSVDQYQPVFSLATMEDRLADALSQRRFNTILLTSFAVLALVLAFVGVYGLISYQVSRSTHEMGIRIALGAQRGDVLKMILGRVLTLVLIGVGFGLIAAFGLTRFLGHLLYEVSATDPRVFLGLGLLLPLLGLLAGFLPARRAMRVEPVIALKFE
jgi:putative ABC transport system permease protein